MRRTTLQTTPRPWRELIRDVTQGLAEIVAWAAVVLVVVGGAGLIGLAVDGGTGVLAGLSLGVVLLGVASLLRSALATPAPAEAVAAPYAGG